VQRVFYVRLDRLFRKIAANKLGSRYRIHFLHVNTNKLNNVGFNEEMGIRMESQLTACVSGLHEFAYNRYAEIGPTAPNSRRFCLPPIVR
jgi:hypothetical protein